MNQDLCRNYLFPYYLNISFHILGKFHVAKIINAYNSFNKYKESYEQKREISIEDNFEISENAVNKQVKGLKSVVKLDENFHIYIHGDNQMIKRGYDNASGLYYYQLFFKEEK